MKKPAEKDIGKLAQAAFLEAAEVVIKRAKDCGTPVIVAENGKIKRHDPYKIRLPRKPRHKN
jgi:hypothetical protein